jgi:hypothetical protein
MRVSLLQPSSPLFMSQLQLYLAVAAEAAPASASQPALMLLAIAAGGTGSAATEPTVLFEAAPASASPATVRMSVAGVCAFMPTPTDSAVAEATASAATSAVADRGTTPTARLLHPLGLRELEQASQPREVSLSDHPLSRAFSFDFLLTSKQTVS